MRILFTCAGRRGYLFQYFREAAPGVEILATDADRQASALVQADRASSCLLSSRPIIPGPSSSSAGASG